jgi:O-antigen/teichoic acid export membrane protein
MQRTFLVNLALVLVLNLVVKPFYILGIDAGVQDAVGPATYGTYAALLSLGFLLNILLDLGITNYNTRHIARHTEQMGEHVGGMTGMRIALALLYGACIMGTGVLLGYRGEQLTILAWLALNQALVATILYLRSNIAGAHYFRTDSLLSVLDRVLLIGMVGWLLWGRGTGVPFRIEWFVWAQTLAYGTTALVALAVVLRISGGVRPGWSLAFARKVLRESFPYALLVLLMTFYYRIDTLMIERLLDDGPYHAGIYYQGFRVFEAFNMLGYLMAALLLPMFSRLLVGGGEGHDELQRLASLAFRLVLAGALAVAVFGSMRAQEVMDLLYASDTGRAAPVFTLLIWSFVAVCTTYVFGTLLTAGGELRTLNVLAGSGALFNIALNLVLVPRFQAEGAAWASLFTQLLTALAQLVLAVRVFDLRPPWVLLARATGYALCLYALAWGLAWVPCGLFTAAVIFGAGAIALAIVLGLVQPRAAMALLKDK